MFLTKVNLIKSKVYPRNITALWQISFMHMFTCISETQFTLVDSLTHRDELREGDHFFPVGDGVKK